MKEHHVRVSHAPENLAHEEQLAWKLARVAVDAAPLDPETSEMIINRVLDNAGVAIAAIARNEIDVILFTTATQVDHLLQIAAEINEEDAVRRALSRVVVASIGPTTSERLREYGIAPDMEPTHPKMGYLVSEAAQRSAEILRQKRIGWEENPHP